jgi:hypothetical protein
MDPVSHCLLITDDQTIADMVFRGGLAATLTSSLGTTPILRFPQDGEGMTWCIR